MRWFFIGTNIQTYIVHLLKKESYNWLEQIVLSGLWILSLGYKMAVKLRSSFYKTKLLKSYDAPLPTICVGNITAGGSGKTPTVMKLAESLQSKYSVAIVSKGYKGTQVKKDKVHNILTSDPAKGYGDEPVMIKNAHPNLSVLVCKDRHLALNFAKDNGFDVAILDDGFQDLSLKADINFVLFNSLRPLEKKYLLPRGFLREDKSALKRANFIGITAGCEIEKIDLSSFDCPVVHFKRDHSFLRGSDTLPLKELLNTRIGAFSAIAHPQAFEKALCDIGTTIVDSLRAADHGCFSSKELMQFSNKAKAKGANYLVCTYKDYIKLPEKKETSLPIYYLEDSLSASSQDVTYPQLIEAIEGKITNYQRNKERSL